jgi:hypothetical protein
MFITRRVVRRTWTGFEKEFDNGGVNTVMKKNVKHVIVSLSLFPDYLEWLDQQAKREGLNRSEYVRLLIDAVRTPPRRRRGGARPPIRAGLDAEHGQRAE